MSDIGAVQRAGWELPALALCTPLFAGTKQSMAGCAVRKLIIWTATDGWQPNRSYAPVKFPSIQPVEKRELDAHGSHALPHRDPRLGRVKVGEAKKEIRDIA